MKVSGQMPPDSNSSACYLNAIKTTWTVNDTISSDAIAASAQIFADAVANQCKAIITEMIIITHANATHVIV